MPSIQSYLAPKAFRVASEDSFIKKTGKYCLMPFIALPYAIYKIASAALALIAKISSPLFKTRSTPPQIQLHTPSPRSPDSLPETNAIEAGNQLRDPRQLGLTEPTGAYGQSIFHLEPQTPPLEQERHYKLTLPREAYGNSTRDRDQEELETARPQMFSSSIREVSETGQAK